MIAEVWPSSLLLRYATFTSLIEIEFPKVHNPQCGTSMVEERVRDLRVGYGLIKRKNFLFGGILFVTKWNPSQAGYGGGIVDQIIAEAGEVISSVL